MERQSRELNWKHAVLQLKTYSAAFSKDNQNYFCLRKKKTQNPKCSKKTQTRGTTILVGGANEPAGGIGGIGI